MVTLLRTLTQDTKKYDSKDFRDINSVNNFTNPGKQSLKNQK